jgi:hypothetical protein
MMLLAAVVLIIGFVALAGMVGRVTQLAGQAGREQDRPLLREIEPMLGAINGAIGKLGTDFGGASPPIPNPATTPSTAYENAVMGMLRHLRQVEAGQGILMDWSLDCATAGDASTGVARITLNDGSLQVTLQSVQFRRLACTAMTG